METVLTQERCVKLYGDGFKPKVQTMSSGQEPFLNESNDVVGAVCHILPSECADGTQLKQTARVKDSFWSQSWLCDTGPVTFRL